MFFYLSKLSNLAKTTGFSLLLSLQFLNEKKSHKRNRINSPEIPNGEGERMEEEATVHINETWRSTRELSLMLQRLTKAPSSPDPALLSTEPPPLAPSWDSTTWSVHVSRSCTSWDEKAREQGSCHLWSQTILHKNGNILHCHPLTSRSNHVSSHFHQHFH